MHYDSLMNKFTWQVTLSRIKVSIEGSSNDARLGDKATKDALEEHNNEDNLHYEPASCKLSSEGTGLLQMSGETGLLQMIIRRDWPLANDHPEGPASSK